MDQANGLALGLVFGIIMMWVGTLLTLFSLPLARGQVHVRGYNYRPWQPQFVKKLSEAEADAIGKRYARYAIVCALVMIALGVVAILFGVVGLGSNVLYLFLVPVALLIVLGFGGYVSAYRMAKSKP